MKHKHETKPKLYKVQEGGGAEAVLGEGLWARPVQGNRTWTRAWQRQAWVIRHVQTWAVEHGWTWSRTPPGQCRQFREPWRMQAVQGSMAVQAVQGAREAGPPWP